MLTGKITFLQLLSKVYKFCFFLDKMNDYDKVLAYLVNQKFIKFQIEDFQQQMFCKTLWANEEMVNKIFLKSERYDDPVLDVVCEWFVTTHCGDRLDAINNAFTDCHWGVLTITSTEVTDIVNQLRSVGGL